jgi:tRNA (uracil-5-)-methyltransferase
MPLSQFRPEHYQQLLADKARELQRQFDEIGAPQATIFSSQPSHYRMRAEFRIWQEEIANYAMFAAGDRKQPVIVNDFPIASGTINRLMPLLRDAINQDNVLRRRWYQAEFLSSTLDTAVVSLIYMRKLDDEWRQAATKLSDALGVSIIGRSRGQRIVIGRDCIEEQFTVDGQTFSYHQPEGAFTQPNAGVNAKMLQWAVDQVRPNEHKSNSGDLLELYCGIGNFTLPLSRHFGRVLATEVSKTATAALHRNIAENHCDNIALARLSAEEATQALQRVRPFKRLSHINLDDYRFSTAFVDPPRAGLDDGTRKLVQSFDNILYISCNPQTLLRDAAAIGDSHAFTSFALFDQFPYTHHAECGALFQRT